MRMHDLCETVSVSSLGGPKHFGNYPSESAEQRFLEGGLSQSFVAVIDSLF